MPRNSVIFRMTLPALVAGMIVLCAAHASAQPTGSEAASQIQNQSDDSTEEAQNAQITPFQGLPQMGATAGQIIGYDPATGLPITQQPQEEEKKKKQVLYDEMDQDMAASFVEPMSIEELQNLERENTLIEGADTGVPLDIRRDAIREAAVSYGARGGLAWRTFFIRRELEQRARELDKVYDFRQLLIPAPSGLLIEPPIINESLNSLLIESDGQQAAVSDRFYNIVNNAKIVSTPRTWRTYLEREWGVVDPPPDILRPENAEERAIWKEMIEKGWFEGVKQADEIFRDDLNVLQADFQGMIRYRILLTQGMVSPPYALQVDRGVTGDGNEMRVGDRAVQITGKPELITGSDAWQPANR
jgi:defect in organelle trafficking protein DotC